MLLLNGGTSNKRETAATAQKNNALRAKKVGKAVGEREGEGERR